MLLLRKFKEHLQNNLKPLKLETEPSTYSYVSGRVYEIEKMLKWIDELPDKEKLDEIIKKIEENNCQSYYKYMDFSYEELLELQKILLK